MMNKRSLILGMALTLMPAGQATAQDAAVDAQQDRYERRAGRRDRFYLNIGGVFLRHDSVDELNARGLPLGTVIDWEDVFGLPESTSSVRVEAHYKFTLRHRVRASYFTTARAADQVLIDEDLSWGGIMIPIDVRVSTKWDTRTLRADYRYSVVQNRDLDVGIALGVCLLRVESSVGINESPVSAQVAQSAPLPMIGVDIEWDLADRFVGSSFSVSSSVTRQNSKAAGQKFGRASSGCR